MMSWKWAAAVVVLSLSPLAAATAQASPAVGSGLPVTLSPRDQVTLMPRSNGD